MGCWLQLKRTFTGHPHHPLKAERMLKFTAGTPKHHRPDATGPAARPGALLGAPAAAAGTGGRRSVHGQTAALAIERPFDLIVEISTQTQPDTST